MLEKMFSSHRFRKVPTWPGDTVNRFGNLLHLTIPAAFEKTVFPTSVDLLMKLSFFISKSTKLLRMDKQILG